VIVHACLFVERVWSLSLSKGLGLSMGLSPSKGQA
jgi:hypothetical protein